MSSSTFRMAICVMALALAAGLTQLFPDRPEPRQQAMNRPVPPLTAPFHAPTVPRFWDRGA